MPICMLYARQRSVPSVVAERRYLLMLKQYADDISPDQSLTLMANGTKCGTSADSVCASLFLQFQHDVWYFHVLLSLVFHSHFKDDVLLVIWDRLLANRLHQLTQPVSLLSRTRWT